MATPTLSVQLSLDASSYGNTYFVLDNATRGKLDNATYTLGGEFYTDITSYVKDVSTSRGRSRELDRFSTGSASISFKNQDRLFDPSNTASTLYPNIVPRRPIRVTANGYSVYTGYVDDWNLSYDISGLSDASAACVDGFAILAKQNLSASTAVAQASGTRIAAVLAMPEVNWPLSLESIDTGSQTLQADVIAQDTNALTYLQLVESSEPGSFFISADGKATFKDRNTAWTVSTATFTDDGTALPYSEISVIYGTELLYNKVVTTRVGGVPQTANSTTSQTTYGVNTLDQSGLLVDTDANALALSNYLLGRYQYPELRFDSITTELSGLTTTQQNQILALEMTNVVTVKYQPNDIGAVITQAMQILGVSHQIRPDSHRVSLKLGATDGRVAFVLNSTAFGVLNTSTIGF